MSNGIEFDTDGIRKPWSDDPRAGPEFITAETGYKVGAAAVQALGLEDWVIVSDTRTFNPELADAIIDGLSTGGGRTMDLGILPTPAAAFMAGNQSSLTERNWGAISVSASHNQASDAGIKVFGARGVKLNDADTRRLEACANHTGPKSLSLTGRSYVQPAEYLRQRYIDLLISTVAYDLRRDRFLTGKDIVVDAANGAAYWSAPEALRRLGANIILINGDPNGEINLNSGATAPQEMIDAVWETGASYGMSLDGDADRLISYSEDKNSERLLDGDDALVLAVKGLLLEGRAHRKGVVATAYSNLGLTGAMSEMGFEVIEVANGDRYVLEALRDGWPVGGEQTGHTLYPLAAEDTGITLSGDGTLSALQELQTAARFGLSPAELSDWPKYPQQITNIKLPSGLNNSSVLLRPGIAKAIDDARRTLGTEGRLHVRKSGTEPKIRVLVQASEQAVVDELSTSLAAKIKEDLL